MSESQVIETALKEPDIVYHYTSLDTLQSIVKNRTLWCTAIAYLNDAKERDFLLDAVRKRLPILRKKGTISEDVWLNTIPVEDVEAVTTFDDEAFIASFTGFDDSLMHWRSYCPQQSGVAIGFDVDCLSRAQLPDAQMTGAPLPEPHFGKVRYIDTEDDKEVDEAITEAHIVANEMRKQHKASSVSVDEWFRWQIEFLATTSKHISFEGEGEYRLSLTSVRFREHNINFRTVRSTLVPYVQLRIPNSGAIEAYDWNPDSKTPWDALRRVVVGPSANMELTKRSLKALFALRDMKVDVEGSIIPYRDW